MLKYLTDYYSAISHAAVTQGLWCEFINGITLLLDYKILSVSVCFMTIIKPSPGNHHHLISIHFNFLCCCKYVWQTH